MIKFPAEIGLNTYETQDELLESLDKEIEMLMKVKDATLVKCLDTALFSLGIEETSCVADRRTLELLSIFEFYKSSPEKAFQPLIQVWFDAHNLLTRLQPRLM